MTAASAAPTIPASAPSWAGTTGSAAVSSRPDACPQRPLHGLAVGLHEAEPAADHHQLGVERVHHRRDRGAQGRRGPGHERCRGGVREHVLRACSPAAGGQRAARGDVLHRGRAENQGVAARPGVRPAAEHRAQRDAGAHRDVEEVAGAAAGAEARLGQRRRAHVGLHVAGRHVRHGRREVDAAQSMVCPLRTWPCGRPARRRPGRRPPGVAMHRCGGRPRAASSSTSSTTAASTASGPCSGAVGTWRRSSTHPPATSTSPAAIFVPPTSTPMTGPGLTSWRSSGRRRGAPHGGRRRSCGTRGGRPRARAPRPPARARTRTPGRRTRPARAGCRRGVEDLVAAMGVHRGDGAGRDASVPTVRCSVRPAARPARRRRAGSDVGARDGPQRAHAGAAPGGLPSTSSSGRRRPRDRAACASRRPRRPRPAAARTARARAAARRRARRRGATCRRGRRRSRPARRAHLAGLRVRQHERAREHVEQLVGGEDGAELARVAERAAGRQAEDERVDAARWRRRSSRRRSPASSSPQMWRVTPAARDHRRRVEGRARRRAVAPSWAASAVVCVPVWLGVVDPAPRA